MSGLTSLVLLLLVAGSVTADGARTWRFRNNGLEILVVWKDVEFDETRSYQVMVSNELRTLARLEVNRDGLVTDAWMTDLDRDGAFEIVVATAQLGGTDEGAVDIHEWQGFRFVSTRPAELSADQRVGYHGNDQFSVVDGRLRRAYPLFVDRDGNSVPIGKMATFIYRYKENRWIAEIR
jgi:hypothetical protein